MTGAPRQIAPGRGPRYRRQPAAARPSERAVAEAALELDPKNPARQALEAIPKYGDWMRRVEAQAFVERYRFEYETRVELLRAAARRFGVHARTIRRWTTSPGVVTAAGGCC